MHLSLIKTLKIEIYKACRFESTLESFKNYSFYPTKPPLNPKPHLHLL